MRTTYSHRVTAKSDICYTAHTPRVNAKELKFNTQKHLFIRQSFQFGHCTVTASHCLSSCLCRIIQFKYPTCGFLVRMCVYCVKCTKFGKLFLTKVIKTVATRCLDFSSKCPKMRLAAGLRPDPLGELKRSPRPPSRKMGAYF